MAQEIIDIFKKHNIDVIIAKNKEDAVEKIMNLIPSGSKVGHSGSVTLEQIGIFDRLKNNDYVFYDRNSVEKGTPEYETVVRKSILSDVYLAGTNAITQDGKLVNKDAYGNRVAAMLYGPKKVIVVVGKNKIVANVNEALKRIENIAAPKNAQRLNKLTPCTSVGRCMDCDAPDRICHSTVIIERQYPNRMTLVIIDEELGF